MKYTKPLTLIAIFTFIFAMGVVFAQDNTNAHGGLEKPQIKERSLKQLKNLDKKQIRNRIERVKRRSKNVLHRINIRIDRLGQIINRVKVISEKFESKGVDISEVKLLISESEKKISKGKEIKEEAWNILESAKETDDLLQTIKNFKTKIIDSYSTIKSGRKDLIKAIRLLKAARSNQQNSKTQNNTANEK